MKKKLKIAGKVIGVLLLVYIVLFNTKSMNKKRALELEESYGEYIAFAFDEPDFSWVPEFGSGSLLGGTFMSGGYVEEQHRVLVMFRWKAYALKKKMKGELREELEELKKSPYIESCTFDEKELSLTIWLVDRIKAENQKEFDACYHYADEEIGHKFYNLGVLYGLLPYEVPFEVHYN